MGEVHLSRLRAFVPGHLSAIGQMVDRLVGKGWLERHRDENDRRKVVLRITERTRKFLGSIEPFGIFLLIERFRTMPGTERKKVLRTVNAMVRLLGADPAEFPPLPMHRNPRPSAKTTREV
jgi:hypothetical protein